MLIRVAKVECIDLDENLPVVVVVRAGAGVVDLFVVLIGERHLEVAIPLPDAKRLVEAIEQGVRIAKGETSLP